ncbi:ATP-binding protein [Bosea sp. 2KB_26]|uniref:ATP-binding protein n=1 Tax=Bosea sp. 2KB_26 TaxID=3237475 RepID=UPI003F909E1D
MTHPTDNSTAVLEKFLAALSPEERDQISVMERVKSRVLRTADRDDAVDRAFAFLLRDLMMRVDPTRPFGPGNRVETRALVVTGKTGAGKSSLLSRMFSNHPAFKGYGTPRSGCPAVTIGTPSPCTPKALGLEILRVLDYPLAAQRTQSYIFSRARDRLQHRGILVLHFDEVHNVLENANDREVREIRKLFKTFMVSDTWPVVLVLSGLPEIVPFFEGLAETDEEGQFRADTKGEVRRRSQFIHLRSLSLPNDIAMLFAALRDVASATGLRFAADMENRVVPRLIHAGLYELGTTMQLTHEAIAEAISTSSPELTLQHFGQAYRARTGCADSVNPFVVTQWQSLDCTLLLKRTPNEANAASLAIEIKNTRNIR